MVKDFNKFEENIIDKILELDQGNHVVEIINILNDQSKLLGGCIFDWCLKNEKFKLFCSKKLDVSNSIDVTFMKEIEKKLYDFIYLLEYLESEKYVAFIECNDIHHSESTDLLQEIPLDSFVTKKIEFLLKQKIKPLHNLYLLKKHKYLDISRYAEKTRDWWYRILTILSILVSLIGIITTKTCTSNVSIKNSICVEKID